MTTVKDTVSKAEFRNAMARVCAPVAIVTSNGAAGRGGFTATAVSSVSDDPPSLLVCMNRQSSQADLFLGNRRFCVNVPSGEHRELAAAFAGAIKDINARYAAVEWDDMPSGSQALRDAIVSFDCELTDTWPVATHNILLGRVVGVRSRADGSALLYFDRSYVHVPTPAGGSGG